MTIGKKLGVLATAGAMLFTLGAQADWRDDFDQITIGLTAAEGEAALMNRYEAFRAHLEDELGVPVQMRTASDYAGIIEAFRSKQIEISRSGPLAYVTTYEVTEGNVESIALELRADGSASNHAVVMVRSDSDYQSLEDLRGASLAFADPNSATGYLVPSFYLREQGYSPDEYFSRTGFAGNHEGAILQVIQGNFDAVATWWHNENSSAFLRMVEKGMADEADMRIVWTSPNIPGAPYFMRKDLPDEMRAAIRSAILSFPEKHPEAYSAMRDGDSSGLIEFEHERFEDLIRMREEERRMRRGG